MKKELLVGLLRGETWTVSQAENEFAPVAPRDVRSEVEDLLQAGVIRSIDGQLKLGSEAEENPESTSNSVADSLTKISTLGPNTEAVYRSISAAKSTVVGLIESTQLSENKVRYALKQLLEAHVIAMRGGRGHRSTRYELLNRD
ncbi:hypothetical protein ACTXN7_05105 [Corynebacterium flavescens]|uniref:hypothetical protein n=1 Tax=Corynebacterium flavescens TaxID=28028 RepID=UPI000952913A|nr:hypothetical protein [Corynebacterium flavescens]KAA8724846.1 hypothetical protein F4V60_00900 [Corynebacterium flavescens]MDN6100517.1 hypothetical protein [Corynebacterium flavescens]MDN6237175.1 hypothetical protein [Corynebacterium flavescens]